MARPQHTSTLAGRAGVNQLLIFGDTSMLKQISGALIAMSALTVSSAFANDGDKLCTPGKVAGSYISLTDGQNFIEQLTLHSDGTVYWYQGTAFDQLVTQGTFIPHIGAWKCINSNTLVFTIIGENYHPESVENPFDLGAFIPDEVPDSYERLTERLVVQSDHITLIRDARTSSSFNLDHDPLGTPDATLSNTVPRTYTKMRVLTTDLP